LFIDAVVSRIVITLSGGAEPPFELAVAIADTVTVLMPSTLPKIVGTTAVCVTTMAFAAAWFP
jgi:hypothetical protein